GGAYEAIALPGESPHAAGVDVDVANTQGGVPVDVIDSAIVCKAGDGRAGSPGRAGLLDQVLEPTDAVVHGPAHVGFSENNGYALVAGRVLAGNFGPPAAGAGGRLGALPRWAAVERGLSGPVSGRL